MSCNALTAINFGFQYLIFKFKASKTSIGAHIYSFKLTVSFSYFQLSSIMFNNTASCIFFLSDE